LLLILLPSQGLHSSPSSENSPESHFLHLFPMGSCPGSQVRSLHSPSSTILPSGQDSHVFNPVSSITMTFLLGSQMSHSFLLDFGYWLSPSHDLHSLVASPTVHSTMSFGPSQGTHWKVASSPSPSCITCFPLPHDLQLPLASLGYLRNLSDSSLQGLASTQVTSTDATARVANARRENRLNVIPRRFVIFVIFVISSAST